MEHLLWILVGAGVAALGGYSLLSAPGPASVAAALWRSEPVSVLEAANSSGAVEVVGTARPYDELLESPLTETECLAYAYRIEARRGDDHDTVESGEGAVPFRVEDDTGAIVVEPDGAMLSLTTGEVREVGADVPFQRSLQDDGFQEDDGGLLDVLGVERVSQSATRRLVEDYLEAGDTVHVYGPVERDLTVARRGGDTNAAIRDDGETRFVVSDTEERWTILRNATLVVATVLVALVSFGVAAYVWLGAS